MILIDRKLTILNSKTVFVSRKDENFRAITSNARREKKIKIGAEPNQRKELCALKWLCFQSSPLFGCFFSCSLMFKTRRSIYWNVIFFLELTKNELLNVSLFFSGNVSPPRRRGRFLWKYRRFFYG